MTKTINIPFSKCPIPPNRGQYWDKLLRMVKGSGMTTARQFTRGKHDYYLSTIGKEANMVIQGAGIGRCRVIGIEKKSFADVTDQFIREDTFKEWSRQDFRRLMKFFYRIEEPDLTILHLETLLSWDEVLDYF